METKNMYRAPFWMWACIVLSLIAAILLSPRVLLMAGVMKGSLTSTLPGVKDVAEAEILFFKIMFLICAVILFAISIFWKKLYNSHIVQSIYNIKLPENINIVSNSFVTKTGLIGYIAIFLAFIYMLTGNKVFSVEALLSINMEDGLLENFTAVFFFAASIISLVILFTTKKLPMSWKIVLSIYAFGFFVLAGEEISWGQRIFGIETMEIMQENNVQKENNLHNLLGYAADHLAIIIVFVYGAVFPFLARIFPFFRKTLYKLGIPVATMGLATGFLISSLIHSWTVGVIIAGPVGLRFAEMREFLTGIMFLLLMIETWVIAYVRYHREV